MQNILITGGSGYLGSKTIDYFKDFTFYGLENKTKLSERNNLLTFQDTDFKKVVSKYKINIIIHLRQTLIEQINRIKKTFIKQMYYW